MSSQPSESEPEDLGHIPTDVGDDYTDIALGENADPRCPVCVVLDCSDSMGDTAPGEPRSPLEALNGALDVLVSEVHKDALSRRRIALSFLPYGTDVMRPTPFATVDGDITVPTLRTMGITNTGAALIAALDHIDRFKEALKKSGVPYYQPILMLLSDGLAMDNLSEASRRITDGQKARKLSFFAVGVQGADLEQMSHIGVRPALGLDGLRFTELFCWLSASAASVSASNPGQDVRAAPVDSWAVI